jgi:hypothetical protein
MQREKGRSPPLARSREWQWRGDGGLNSCLICLSTFLLHYKNTPGEPCDLQAVRQEQPARLLGIFPRLER